MNSHQEITRLKTIKAIAETLNQGNRIEEMLQTVLKELLHVTKLETGWIYLIDTHGNYELVADVHLPPALSWGEKKPMCEGNCWCIKEYNDNTLKRAFNIIGCKRIEDAIIYKWGDTKGITHHATVPLQAGDERFGLLNVAAPNKARFTSTELNLLEAVAFQIGTAIKRMKLYQNEQKRASLYQKLGQISANLNATRAHETNLINFAVNEIHNAFSWSGIELECNHSKAKIHPTTKDSLRTIEKEIRIGETKGKLKISHSHLDHIDEEMITQLSNHLAILFENARIDTKSREIALIEERNRLARDLHDSVNQLLFSLSLTARGMKELKEIDQLHSSLSYIQELSQEALQEMRSLIWQLRPSGLENGVASALTSYGEMLLLKVDVHLIGLLNVKNSIEECLWRVGQEALNNIKKHAQTTIAKIHIEVKKEKVTMIIKDEGIGFDPLENEHGASIGLSSMKERVELHGGKLNINTTIGKGTTISVSLPT
ncbi:GAF domain-containing sensor histidine kinase [Alkalihalobacterium elongatum]|uniref:GAF domain-containing sensor histidine kinase n=1 Tax=Alkalihalobacterium elongatum TaxID=2675466 RepID=UPI001C1FCE3B|nr:GAF domain-containing sensor histidine kinase [Alkalihalobacterium elongatum]